MTRGDDLHQVATVVKSNWSLMCFEGRAKGRT